MVDSLSFYSSLLCPYCKPVEYLLQKENIKHTFTKFDLLKGEHLSEEYRKINPFQRVPAIVDGDFVLFESTTLLKYICNSRTLSEHWYPKDPKQRALVDLYIDFHVQNSGRLAKYTYVSSGFGKETLEEAQNISDNAFKEFENIFLSKTKFIVSNDFITKQILLWSGT